MSKRKAKKELDKLEEELSTWKTVYVQQSKAKQIINRNIEEGSNVRHWELVRECFLDKYKK